MKRFYIEILISILMIFSFFGCLKDAPTNPVEVKTGNYPVLLSYLEEHGDYINSESFPSLVDAQEVYNNISSYLIIDVRKPQEFAAGHIQNSINIQPDSLLIFMKSITAGNYSKIVIVSGTGQSASYYGCLLILDGFTNVFAMRYGMAAWNNAFSSVWLNALTNTADSLLTGVDYQKAGYSALPSPAFPDPGASIKSKLEFRINKLLSEGFEEELKHSYVSPVDNIGQILFIDTSNSYSVCLGVPLFYKSYWGIAHPRYAVNYQFAGTVPAIESVNYLQTLPSSKTIFLYSYSGHISAFFTAYLRILGYDARSILFGGNNFIYSTMFATPGVSQYAFTTSDINNFPYVTGN